MLHHFRQKTKSILYKKQLESQASVLCLVMSYTFLMNEQMKKFLSRRVLGKENPNSEYRVGITVELQQMKTGVTELKMSYRGEEVGYARLSPDGDKKYLLKWLEIYDEFQGKDFGGNLLDAVNNFLDQQGAVGRLANHISNPLKYNMYRRHGWKRKLIGGGGYYYYTPKNKAG